MVAFNNLLNSFKLSVLVHLVLFGVAVKGHSIASLNIYANKIFYAIYAPFVVHDFCSFSSGFFAVLCFDMGLVTWLILARDISICIFCQEICFVVWFWTWSTVVLPHKKSRCIHGWLCLDVYFIGYLFLSCLENRELIFF